MRLPLLLSLLVISCSAGCMVARPGAFVLVAEPSDLPYHNEFVEPPAQPSASSAVDIIRNAARGNFPPLGLNPQSFSGKEFDPLIVEAIWQDVRQKAIMQLAGRPEATLLSGASLYIGDSKDGRQQLVFATNPVARDLLKQALDWPDSCFSNQSSLFETITQLQAKDLDQRFHTNGTVLWNEVADATSSHMQSHSTTFSTSGFSPGKTTNDNGAKWGVVGLSNPKSAVGWFPNSGDSQIFMRVWHQFRRSGDSYEIVVTIQFARRSGAQKSPEFTNSDYMLDRYDTKVRQTLLGVSTRKTPNLVPNGTLETGYKGDLQDPLASSTLGTLQRTLMEEYAANFKVVK